MFFSWVRRVLSGLKTTESSTFGKESNSLWCWESVRTRGNGGEKICGKSRKGIGIQFLDSIILF